MTDYDFVEIGTADFESLAQQYPDAKGMSVEPIKMYLDRLPDRPNITKVNAALVTQASYEMSPEISVFYIKEDVIRQYSLGEWMKGCNSVGKPHDFHTGYYHDAGVWHDAPDRSILKTRNLLFEGIVTTALVPSITWKILMLVHNIEHIDVLKTDTEGMDAVLLKDVLNFYWQFHRMGDLPKIIHFEDNAHTNKNEMISTKEMLVQFGYDVDDSHKRGHDSYATLKKVTV